MSDVDTSDGRRVHDRLIDDLVADLRPVRRLATPWLRAAAWLAIVLAAAIVLAWFADMPAMEHRLMAVPDMWLAVLGSVLTAILAAVATFQLGLPDRSPLWSLLPLPGLVLWIGASGLGCARTWLIPGTSDPSLMEGSHCMMVIVALSVPLSIAIFAMLRRGYSLYPSLTGGTAGLAVAAAAATLLNFFHPYDAAITDLTVHAAAVTLVVLVNRALAGRFFRSKPDAIPGGRAVGLGSVALGVGRRVREGFGQLPQRRPNCRIANRAIGREHVETFVEKKCVVARIGVRRGWIAIVLRKRHYVGHRTPHEFMSKTEIS